MEFFTSVYFVIFLCLVGIVLALLLCREIIRILTINKLREGKGRGPSHICDLLCERFPEATVYKNVRFLKEEAAKDGLKCACDVVYISKGGVLLLTVFPDVGTYDNPKIGPWRHRYINTKKETITLQKSNPFDTMAFFATVAEKLMISEEVLNPSVTRAVVFSADHVDFTTDYPECLTVATLFDYVEAFNRRKHFNSAEYAGVCQAISACADYLEEKATAGKEPEEGDKKPRAVRRPPVSEERS
ncbi:MAG: hypothetical protein IJX59_07920 [Clostridia bacterium]|nr:hypothetical protein [Clostridia bacterium]MBQ9130671.1 hypothetical protein [Clostridia bacterium]